MSTSPLYEFAQDLGMGKAARSQAPADPLTAATAKYPWLGDMGLRVQWGPEQRDQRQMEFYPPWERDNPNPGIPTIELYNRTLSGDALSDAIAAEALHLWGAVDPRSGQAINPAWRDLRQKFHRTMTPEQATMNRAAYQQDARGRSFDNFMEQSRIDAYLRAYLFPQANPEWSRMRWSDEQRAVLDEMRGLLKKR